MPNSEIFDSGTAAQEPKLIQEMDSTVFDETEGLKAEETTEYGQTAINSVCHQNIQNGTKSDLEKSKKERTAQKSHHQPKLKTGGGGYPEQKQEVLQTSGSEEQAGLSWRPWPSFAADAMAAEVPLPSKAASISDIDLDIGPNCIKIAYKADSSTSTTYATPFLVDVEAATAAFLRKSQALRLIVVPASL
eukprot:gnl/MRDRNA2_/MRDRNA2_73383_c0_seq2.p1 gnl/MRDRNA2_/MRDRNA2_73383_c0~~gnl/MRDRNA2_/MRDRNA2_73383_c0_seq2.p1  ORF type:complete len:200 (-),score=50.31 gnl/MRDRNA2_/MRDRNA2_73383_c0_seq2:10-579(-)